MIPQLRTHFAGRPMTRQVNPQATGLWAQSAGRPQAIPPSGAFTTLNQNIMNSPMPVPTQGSPKEKTAECRICHKSCPSAGVLWQHYARFHFLSDLKSDYGAMANINNKSCNECGHVFKSADSLFLHIGTVHRKVNEILERKGFGSLEHGRMRKLN